MPSRIAKLALDAHDPQASEAAADVFHGVVQKYSRYVASIASRVLGNDDEIQDVVQDVFSTAWQNVSLLRDPDAIRFWLGRIAVNRATSVLRWRRVRMRFGIEKPIDYEAIAAVGADPEQRADIAKLYALLDRLPAKHRIAWVLRYMEGEELENVARLCGCSLAAAKRRITAAQATIQKAFDANAT